MADIEPKDRVNWLFGMYQAECTDNAELYRRGAFILTGLLALGSFSFALLRLSKAVALWPSLPSAMFMLLFVGCVGFLCASAFSLGRALLPGDWEYPDFETAGGGTGEEIIADLRRCVDANRVTNERRYAQLQWALRFVFATMLTLALEGGIAAVLAANPHSEGESRPKVSDHSDPSTKPPHFR